MTGFPERRANLVKLSAGDAKERKIEWVATLLRELGEQKLLLICHTRELAEEVYERLQQKISVKSALFHEKLTLIQRDRNAAFFSEEDGAQILICSEIGSEGRNFQFAHHLVLFDLPDDPELLEQRIGRLDRIGQTSTITIHVPFQTKTGSEVLTRWYHEGLNAFEKSLHGATEIAQASATRVAEVCNEPSEPRIKKLIAATRKHREAVSARLSGGYDRLLELSSCKPEKAAGIIEEIRSADEDGGFEAFVTDLLDFFGVNIEEMGARSYVYQPGHLLTDAFPALPREGLSVTFDRIRALSRDDMNFMSFDHPMLRGAIDLLLGSEAGNAAFGIWNTPGPEAILLEVYFVAECVAPASLHADRFLPATPIRVVVDHSLENRSADRAPRGVKLKKGNIHVLLDKTPVRRDLLPAMIQCAVKFATREMEVVIASANAAMKSKLQGEIERLEDLRILNDHVRQDEIGGLRRQLVALEEAISGTRLRLDAVRMIWKKAA